MRIKIAILGFAFAASLCAQKKSWQDACFNNPGAPYCQGHDFAIKKQPQANTAPANTTTAPRGVVGRPSAPSARTAAPALIVVGSIDWRFADPFPDALIGMNFNTLAASPLARNLVAQLGAQQGLAAADIQKIFDGLSDVDQVAISVRDNRMVVMVTGRVTNADIPAPEAGLKVFPVSGNSMLVGHADAVDQAARRLAMQSQPSDLTRMAEQQQAASEFWLIGSPRMAGPQAASAGVKRISLTVSIRERFSSDMAVEFNSIPNANIVRALQTSMGPVTLEGNAAHVRMSMEGAEVQQKFASIAAGPLGQQLSGLIAAAKYLPARDTTVPKQTKPVIYGLDDGPKVVNQ
jgi:hypothetical protein